MMKTGVFVQASYTRPEFVFFSWVGQMQFAGLRHSSDVVRDVWLWAEDVSTFESGDGYGGVIPCALCAEARNSSWARFGRLRLECTYH